MRETGSISLSCEIKRERERKEWRGAMGIERLEGLCRRDIENKSEMGGRI